jgi:hypothetical protein
MTSQKGLSREVRVNKNATANVKHQEVNECFGLHDHFTEYKLHY